MVTKDDKKWFSKDAAKGSLRMIEKLSTRMQENEQQGCREMLTIEDGKIAAP